MNNCFIYHKRAGFYFVLLLASGTFPSSKLSKNCKLFLGMDIGYFTLDFGKGPDMTGY